MLVLVVRTVAQREAPTAVAVAAAWRSLATAVAGAWVARASAGRARRLHFAVVPLELDFLVPLRAA